MRIHEIRPMRNMHILRIFQRILMQIVCVFRLFRANFNAYFGNMHMNLQYSSKIRIAYCNTHCVFCAFFANFVRFFLQTVCVLCIFLANFCAYFQNMHQNMQKMHKIRMRIGNTQLAYFAYFDAHFIAYFNNTLQFYARKFAIGCVLIRTQNTQRG